jgi:hypothetical protein
MRSRLILFAAIVIAPILALQVQAAELKAVSVDVWNTFVRGKDAQIRQHGALKIAGTGDAEELRNGTIQVRPLAVAGAEHIPSALIHDWVGTVFIPHTSLPEVLGVVRSYLDYPSIYKPAVAKAGILQTTPTMDRYSVVMRQDVLTIRTGLEGEYVSEYHQIDPTHWYSTTRSVCLREILKYGSEEEHLADSEKGNGFIWRIYSEARYEQADGGVYLQLEGTALSRTVPHALSWFVNPVIERISRSALTTTLRQTREAVHPGE